MAAKPDPVLEKLNRLLGENRLPCCAETLWERILSNMASKARLGKIDPKRECKRNRNLNPKLRETEPESSKDHLASAGGERMDSARQLEAWCRGRANRHV